MTAQRKAALPILVAVMIALAGGGAWLLRKHVLPGVGGLPASPAAFPKSRPPGALANFELIDTEGKAHELYRYGDHKAIVLLTYGNDCPIVQKNVRTILELRKKYAGQGVAWLGIDASTVDTRESIRKEAGEYGIDWPILRDPSQRVAKQLGFTRTSEVALIDTRSWAIVFRGAVDDRLDYGVNKGEARNRFLDDALASVLRGRAPERAVAEAKGCAITYKEESEPLTYARHIAPILKAKCLNCHSEAGAIRPFFTDYESVKGWGAMIRETVMTGRMPVWGIDSEPGEFINDNSMSPDQKRRLIAWIDANAPRGEGEDPLRGYAPKISDQPEKGATFTAEMDRDFDIPPEGFNEYHYFQLGGPLPRDMWVTMVEGFTSNPRALHHGTLYVTPEPMEVYDREAEALRAKGVRQNGSDIWMGIAIKANLKRLAAKAKPAPGSPYKVDELIRFAVYSTYGRNNARSVPQGTARFLPKGYYLILETHHNGSGKPEKERTKLYFYETKKTPAIKPIHRVDQIAFDISIPPYAKDYRIDLPVFVAEKDLYLLACNSHMHIRGRELQAWASFPEGGRRRLLSVSSFNYEWHSAAQAFYSKPVFIPKGTRLESYAIVDNSPWNPYNPDPSRTVVFGQTLDQDEMPKFQCIFHYADE